MITLGDPVSLAAFAALPKVSVPPAVRDRLRAARRIVDAAAASDAPVYGLTTGLGANVGMRIPAADIAGFQRQIIDGRAMAVGPPLAPEVGRAMLLARIVSASHGAAGLSEPVFEHLCAVYAAGLAPEVPRWGSIAASDLVQNAVWAEALLGAGRLWDGSDWHPADALLAARGIAIPDLQPKDGLALISHSALTVAQAGLALSAVGQSLRMLREAAALSCLGFQANTDIFAPDINGLRISPGQAETARWYAERLAGCAARRVQDPLSFRTLAPTLGAAMAAWEGAVRVWEDELNGTSDSPVVIAGAAMRSTPNFQSPALALALEQVALSLAMVASGAVQRCQRLLEPELSDLPRFLSAEGGASAGLAPLQKTAAALQAEVRRHAMPVSFDPPPSAAGVEDAAPMTASAAAKLGEAALPLRLLAGLEALVAAQAISLRGGSDDAAFGAIRDVVPMVTKDRPLGRDVETVADVLAQRA